jgi:cytochrome c556
MKTKLLLLAVLLVVAAGLSVGKAQTKRNRAAKEFMRDKLELSQRVLEGLATEDFDLIIAKGTRLNAMSQEADWRLFENPDYDQQSVVFRRHVNSLVKAAKDRNLDAATLGYVRMTMSCVDCHKLVRGKLVASAGGLRATTLAAGPPLDLTVSASRQERVSTHQAERSIFLNEQASSTMKMDR